MKINIPNLSLQLSEGKKPFDYFLYIPHCPHFEDAHHESIWLERAKLYMYDQIQLNQHLRKGQYHFVYLPDDVMNAPNNDHIYTPPDYDDGWCLMVYHPLHKSDVFDDLMRNINVPYHCPCILVPNVQEYIQSSFQSPDLVDTVIVRFLVLLSAFLFAYWFMHILSQK